MKKALRIKCVFHFLQKKKILFSLSYSWTCINDLLALIAYDIAVEAERCFPLPIEKSIIWGMECQLGGTLVLSPVSFAGNQLWIMIPTTFSVKK